MSGGTAGLGQDEIDALSTVDELVAALAQQPVLVQTVLGEGDTAGVSARLREAVREVDVPSYVLLVQTPSDVTGDRPSSELIVLLERRGAPDGLHVVGTTDDIVDIETVGVQIGPPEVSLYLAYADARDIVEESYPRTDSGFSPLISDAGAAEVALATAAAVDPDDESGFSPDPEVLAEIGALSTTYHPRGDVRTAGGHHQRKLRRQHCRRRSGRRWAGRPPAGRAGRRADAGIVVLAVRRRRGRPARGTAVGANRPTFRLPAGVVGRVRSAEARRTARSADAEVLALGEDVDAADMDARADQAWQQVLDHYSAARSLLDGSNHPADVVGALVLARRGQRALDAARRHATFTPDVPCYLNPLHPPGSHQVEIGAGDARVEVPACPGCRRDLQAGRDPDVLDVSVAQGAVPYYESGREPWASTGYGALDTDLVGRLTEYRAGRGV